MIHGQSYSDNTGGLYLEIVDNFALQGPTRRTSKILFIKDERCIFDYANLPTRPSLITISQWLAE